MLNQLLNIIPSSSLVCLGGLLTYLPTTRNTIANFSWRDVLLRLSNARMDLRCKDEMLSCLWAISFVPFA